ncbi:hypothetical protein HRbin15_02576 [bacterium HR15]|nr:hypothetical protein HRbin15_02576 [bacterium HR15]
MSDQEFNAVWRLPKEKRYEYFVKRVADWRTIWCLQSPDGLLKVAGCANGRVVVPLWPHPRYAEVAATGSWIDGRPEPIGVIEWLAEEMLVWEEAGYLIGVFLTVNESEKLDGIVVSPAGLADDLVDEMSKYEDFDKIASKLRRRGFNI